MAETDKERGAERENKRSEGGEGNKKQRRIKERRNEKAEKTRPGSPQSGATPFLSREQEQSSSLGTKPSSAA